MKRETRSVNKERRKSMKANKRKKTKMEYGRKIAGDNEQKKMKRNEKWRLVEDKIRENIHWRMKNSEGGRRERK